MPWDQRSQRRAELPHDWPIIRRDVLERDAYWCQIQLAGCTGIANQCDHIGAKTNHSRTNLRAACAHCHAKRTAHQGQDAMRQARAQTRHRKERHPGFA